MEPTRGSECGSSELSQNRSRVVVEAGTLRMERELCPVKLLLTMFLPFSPASPDLPSMLFPGLLVLDLAPSPHPTGDDRELNGN